MKDLLYLIWCSQDAAIPAFWEQKPSIFLPIASTKKTPSECANHPQHAWAWYPCEAENKQNQSHTSIMYYIIIHLAIWGGNQKSIEIPMVIFFRSVIFSLGWFHVILWVGVKAKDAEPGALAFWDLQKNWKGGRFGVADIQRASVLLGDESIKKMGIHKSMTYIILLSL